MKRRPEFMPPQGTIGRMRTAAEPTEVARARRFARIPGSHHGCPRSETREIHCARIRTGRQTFSRRRNPRPARIMSTGMVGEHLTS